MQRTLIGLSLLLVTCASAGAQVVQIDNHPDAQDVWGRYFNPRKVNTFSGRVTAVAKTHPTKTSDVETTLLVQSLNGGDTYVVELAPSWYVDKQVAKIHKGDKVQVIGTRLSTKNRVVYVASSVVVNGQGGPVLALRRPSGRAYWLGTEVVAQVDHTPNEQVVSDASLDDLLNQMPPPPQIIQSNNGFLNIDVGPYWYGRSNYVIPVGNYAHIVSGPYPFTIWPF